MKLGLITVSEAAARKGVSRSAIYKAIDSGRLKGHRVLGKVALREKEVEAWHTSASAGRPKGNRLSQATKARISESQRNRWVERKRKLQEAAG